MRPLGAILGGAVVGAVVALVAGAASGLFILSRHWNDGNRARVLGEAISEWLNVGLIAGVVLIPAAAIAFFFVRARYDFFDFDFFLRRLAK